MLKKFVFTILLFCLIAMPVCSFADIYMYVDKDGVIHFTNMPLSSRYRLYLKEGTSKDSDFYSTDRFDHYINAASRKHGVAFELIKAIIKVESDFDTHAISKAGAMGLMQIMPENVGDLNIKNPFDPYENIMAGSSYFSRLLKRFDGDLQIALAAYNAGPETVDKYRKTIPPYQETQNYVKKVMKYYAAYNSGRN